MYVADVPGMLDVGTQGGSLADSAMAAGQDSPPPGLYPFCSYLRRMLEFQWFLIALSVRPGSSFAISAHLLPHSRHAVTITASSASVHGPLLMSAHKWLCHRSRHCFPSRPFSASAITVHDLAPCRFT